MERKALISFALLLVMSGAYAQAMPINICRDADIPTTLTNYWNLRFGNWVDLCALGILISFFTISVLYMISQGFGKPGLAAWCKSELFQVFVAGIILGGLFGFVTFSCSVAKPSIFINLDDNGDGVPDHPDNMFDYADEYLGWLRDRTYTVYYITAVFNGLVSQLASVFVNSSPGGFGIAMRPLSGLNSLSSMLTFIMNTLLIGAVFPTMAQIRMLHVIERMMFNIFLPIGLMARCFQPTRRFGGSVIAIAIGLFLFYPFLLMLNAAIVRDSVVLGVTVPGIAGDVNAGNTVDSVGPMFNDPADPNYYGTALTPDAQATRYGWSQDPNGYDPNLGGGGTEGPGHAELSKYENIFTFLYWLVLDILIAALFLPLINFLLLVTFILNLSRLLGEEVDVTNITRMI